jgi:hypothetical protein
MSQPVRVETWLRLKAIGAVTAAVARVIVRVGKFQ